MKELSTEEKAKRYDEVLETAKKIHSGEGVPAPPNMSVLEVIFPELKESEDEIIRRRIIQHFTDEIEGLKRSPNAEEYEAEIEELSIYIAWLEKQGEQKPSDKVEPKFHEGDWVVSPNGVYWHIDAIQDGRYQVSSDSGVCADWPLDTNIYHKFDIQDAKDGDVLTCYSDIKGQPIEQTGIIKQYVGRHGGCSNSFKAHFGVDWDNNVVIEGYMGSSNIYPSTKEQRDTLMKAMTDAGYTFDFERKELKKIEQKPEWSDEDTNLREATIGLLNLINPIDAKSWGKSRLDCVDWLRSLKDRVQSQTKQKWNEDDEKYLKHAIEDFQKLGDSYLTSWLKSLRPQNMWKPSDEQIEALKGVQDGVLRLSILQSLYDDLLKLTK